MRRRTRACCGSSRRPTARCTACSGRKKARVRASRETLTIASAARARAHAQKRSRTILRGPTMNRISTMLEPALAATGVLSLALLAAAPAAAQPPQRGAGPAAAAQSAPATGEIPRLANGKQDLSGVWWGGADVGGPGCVRGGGGGRRGGGAPPRIYADLFQPWAKVHAAEVRDKDEPALQCKPTAFGTLIVRL